jgi:triosephosphate isomerase (TIM)
MRRPMMAGNWKMNCDNAAALELAGGIVASTGGTTGCDIVIAPAFTALSVVNEVTGDSPVALAAQNMYWEEAGAFTGEIAADMLLSCGCEYVILGHSERRGRFGVIPEGFSEQLRSVFGDNDATVNIKAKAAVAAGLKPIICCGELLAEREQGMTDAIVSDQVRAFLDGCGETEFAAITIAYEPVWAIGTGEVCDADEANRVCGVIRGVVAEVAGQEIAEAMRILYGGSVKPDNVEGLMAQPEIDGGLVGGASLEADSFCKLIAVAAAS